MTIQIDLYSRLSPELLYEKGKAAGLSEEAADYLRYLVEIHLTLTVEQRTGKVIAAMVSQDFSS